jgi:hypothetical protein
MKIASLLAVVGLACAAGSASAQLSYTGTSLSQNFDSLSSVAWANNTTLPGWFLFRQPTPGTALTTISISAASSTGTFYAFGSAGERGLGGVGSGGAYYGSPANNAVAGWMAVAITNNSGQDQASFTLGFDGEQWRNAGATNPNVSVAQTMVLEYGFGASFDTVTTWTAPGGNFDWASPVIGTTAAAAVDGNTAGLVAGRGGTITDNWAAGTTLWIRWVERNDPGNDHAMGIDNFTFSSGPAVALNPNVTKDVANPADQTALPANIPFVISNVQNIGTGSTSTATITADFPATLTYNAGASTLPAGVTANFVPPTLTISLPTLNAGQALGSNITIVMTSAITEFPATFPLVTNWVSTVGGDADSTSAVVALPPPTGTLAPISFTGSNLSQDFQTIVAAVATSPFSATTGTSAAIPGTAMTGWAVSRFTGSSSTALPFFNALPTPLNPQGAASGGIYRVSNASDNPSNIALGSLASGSNSPAFGIAIKNDSANTLTSFTVGFDGIAFRQSTSIDNKLDFSYSISTDNVSTIDNFLSNTVTATDVDTLDVLGDPFVTVQADINPPTKTAYTGTVNNVSIPAGATLFLRWRDVNEAGNDGGVGIDNFTFSASSGGGVAGCNPADIACDDGTPLVSAPGCTNSTTGPNEGDYNAFFAADGFFFQSGQGPAGVGGFCDIACDNGDPLASSPGCTNGGVNEGDYNCFFNNLFIPCI